MKKIISILMTLVFAMSMMTGCAAAENITANTANDFILTMQVGNPVMTVNGAEQEIDPGNETAPVVINDRTLAPIRAIIEAMGGTVGWEQETQTVALNYGSDEIRLIIDNTTAYLNGDAHTLDTAPTIINDRTMLPIRFIAESFEFDVDWTQETQTVTIIKKAENGMTSAVTPSADTKDSKVLVAYFSMPDNVDDSTVTINGQVLGNNQYFAQVIQEETGADVFRIEAQTPYPTDHETLVDIASEEQKDNARPAIKNTIENFDDYDVIFVGYPIWWSDMPMIMYTFFDTYDFSGKTIIPFGTHGGSGWAGTPDTIAELEPNAEIIDGLSISRDNIEDAHDQISEWVKNVLPISPTLQPDTDKEGKTLVVYYSATNTTERIANMIADNTDATVFELEPKDPYTDADLDWTDDTSRVNDEHNNPDRHVELVSTTVENFDIYDTVYIGYPIWWHEASWVVDDFVKNNDFTGKTVIPFCTSASSPLGDSGEKLAAMAGTGNWIEGRRFSSGTSEADVQEWIDSLK